MVWLMVWLSCIVLVVSLAFVSVRAINLVMLNVGRGARIRETGGQKVGIRKKQEERGEKKGVPILAVVYIAAASSFLRLCCVLL